jgi:hypothetical protein
MGAGALIAGMKGLGSDADHPLTFRAKARADRIIFAMLDCAQGRVHVYVYRGEAGSKRKTSVEMGETKSKGTCKAKGPREN